MNYRFSRPFRAVYSIALLAVYVLTGCAKSNSDPTPKNTTATPAITSLGASAGPYNTIVTIIGTGFSETAADDHVFFNGKTAAVTAATSTELVATVPLSAGTGKVTISVGNGAAVSGPVFTYQPSRTVTTFAGSGVKGSANGTGTNASFNSPTGLCIDATGNIYVADRNNNLIRMITPGGVVTTFAGGGPGFRTNGLRNAASFAGPTGLTSDANGNIYVADFDNSMIRKIDPSGLVSTLAGAGGIGLGNGTGIEVSFSGPFGIGADKSGNLYMTDFYNNVIRKVTATGVASTFAGGALGTALDGIGTRSSFNYPLGLAVDDQGNIYVADTSDDLIRKITPAGVVTTFAGSGSSGLANGTGTQASFNKPVGLATDKEGNVYVTDAGNNQIRKITPAGVVTTFASSSVNGMGINFNNPMGIAVDKDGNVYVADTGNNVIRKISFQ